MPKFKGVQKKGHLYYGYLYYKTKCFWSTGFTTAEEASRWRAKTKSELTGNTYVGKTKTTVEEFIGQYLRDYAGPSLRVGTLKNNESMLRLYIIPHLGHLHIQDVRPLHIQQLQNRLLRDKSPVYVFNIMRLFRQVLNIAVKWDVVPSNPSLKIDLPRVKKSEYTILPPERLMELLSRLCAQDKAVIALAAFAGLRRGEIFGLQWPDIDLKQKKINLQRQYFLGRVMPLKTESSRMQLPICRTLSLILATWKLRSGSPHWVFPGKGGKPLYPDTWIAKHFRKILKQNLLPPMRFHDLRHTFVSILIGEGIPTADVQKLARHASYQTTVDIYRHLLPDELEKGLNHLDLLLESIEKTWKKDQDAKAL
jgi:integrase